MNFGRVGGYANLYFPFTYTFNVPNVGTYANHFHLNTVLHFEMGIDGTVFIRQPDGSTGLVWTNGPAFEKENIWHLHTFISSWHSDDGGMVSGLGTVRHCPDYFMIDGCDGNDTLTNPAFAQCAEKNHLKKNRQSQNGSAFII